MSLINCGPWNEGKLIRRKVSFKLKDIWDMRVWLHEPSEARWRDFADQCMTTASSV
jgi:hypothetical protein